MIKRILLGIGGTPFTAVAVERAVELAALHDARITAATVADPDQVCKLGPVPAGAGFHAKRMCENRLEVKRNQIEDVLAELEKACEASGVRYNVVWETGNSFDLMIAHARYHDITIFGLRSLFEYHLNQDPMKDIIKLLSQGVRPMLSVSDKYRKIEKVLVAYSGSMESAKAMKHFVQFKLWPNAELEIVYFSDGSEADGALLKDAEEYCQDHGYTANTRMILGKASEQLLAEAQKMNADMIVMGNSNRNTWLRKVLGDNLLKTLTEADRPLFLSQ